MEATMQSFGTQYQMFMGKLNNALSSKKAIVAIAAMLGMALAMMMEAHAGTGGTSFAAIATRVEGWAQGDLGLTIVAGGLIFGVASMVFTGRGTILAVVVGGAVALYYGIPVLVKIFAATGGASVAKTLVVHGAHMAGIL